MSAVPVELRAAAQDVLFREALYLDTQRWDDWLALYEEGATFWIPAWIDEHTQTASPDTELSLIYCAARAGLEDRVWRIRSGLSAASTPLLRTAHAVACPVVSAIEGAGPARLRVESSWTCHVHHPKRREEHVFFGRCEHVLRERPQGWRIAAKKVVLMNDTIPTMLDFYCV
jgi:3-phenylpropionate/cinnamic acid dioxygenase small subunit